LKELPFTPPGGPPRVAPPDPRIYPAMGQDNIFRMLEDFYTELSGSPISGMFATDPAVLQEQAHKSARFFTGLLGGPPLYHEKHGNPALRFRHLPFPIDSKARLIWLGCFKKVLVNAELEYNFPAEYLPGFLAFIEGFSTWMVNKSS